MKQRWVIRIAGLAGVVAAGVVFARWEPPVPPEVMQRRMVGQMREARRMINEGEAAAAIESLRAVVERFPETPEAWYLLGRAYDVRGEPGDEARTAEAFDRTNDIETRRAEERPDANEFYNLGWTRRRMGRADAVEAYAKATDLQAQAIARMERPHEIWLYNLACYAALAGRHDEAVDAFARAVERGYDDLWHLRRDVDLDPIRDDQRFKAAVQRIVDSRAWMRAEPAGPSPTGTRDVDR
ncbi:MAG: tetratricopeptide repeat protein [Phycisphaerales bacterium]